MSGVWHIKTFWYIEYVILENICIFIDIIENINIDKAILENIDIDCQYINNFLEYQ